MQVLYRYCRSLFSVVCCLLSVVCCLLSVVCCLLSVVCCLLSVVCCLLSVVCCLLSVVCCLLSVVCCLLSVACCLLSVVCCLLSVVCCCLVCRTSYWCQPAHKTFSRSPNKHNFATGKPLSVLVVFHLPSSNCQEILVVPENWKYCTCRCWQVTHEYLCYLLWVELASLKSPVLFCLCLFVFFSLKPLLWQSNSNQSHTPVPLPGARFTESRRRQLGQFVLLQPPPAGSRCQVVLTDIVSAAEFSIQLMGERTLGELETLSNRMKWGFLVWMKWGVLGFLVLWNTYCFLFLFLFSFFFNWPLLVIWWLAMSCCSLLLV